MTAPSDHTAISTNPSLLVDSATSERLRDLFHHAIRAGDVADSLPSFDADADAAKVRGTLSGTGRDVVGVRRAGHMAGYARTADLQAGPLSNHLLSFDGCVVLSAATPLAEVMQALDSHERIFVRMLGEVAGEITRHAVQKPAARMWLFGMITIVEMNVQRAIEILFPADSWCASVTPGRLEKAKALWEERHRRGQSCSLLDCLQTADKGQILLQDDRIREKVGLASKRQAMALLSGLEGLRNSLAHSQEILPEHWPIVVKLSQSINDFVSAARLSRVLADQAGSQPEKHP